LVQLLLYRYSFRVRFRSATLRMQAVMMQGLEAYMQMPKRRKMRALLRPILYTLSRGPSVVVFARLFLFVFLLLLLALAVTLLSLELLFPELVYGVAVDVGKDDLEDVRVPLYGLAFNAFFDVLGRC
jgi:hypothetical protein